MSNLNGILLVIGAMAAFTAEDALIKHLSTWFPTGQILIALGIGAGAVFAALALIRGHSLFARHAWQTAALVRALSEAIAATAFITALSLIDISTVAAVFQATPLAITMGAALFLGEQVGWRRWSAILVGFCGVLLIIRPGLDGFEPAALLVLVAVAAIAVRDLSTRFIVAEVSSLVVSFQGFASIIFSGALLIWLQGDTMVTPQPRHYALIAATLIFSVSGYYAIVQAMRVADASAVQPFRYTRLVFSMLAGILIFGERPDTLTLAGAGLVIATGLYTFLREHQLARRAARAAA